MQIKGGSIIGTPTTTSTISANGIWYMGDVYNARRLSSWPAYQPVVSTTYLVVAGGGGGSSAEGGGGGAGGLLSSTASLTLGTTYTVTVGSGGAGGSGVAVAGSNGSNSILSGTPLRAYSSKTAWKGSC